MIWTNDGFLDEKGEVPFTWYENSKNAQVASIGTTGYFGGSSGQIGLYQVLTDPFEMGYTYTLTVDVSHSSSTPISAVGNDTFNFMLFYVDGDDHISLGVTTIVGTTGLEMFELKTFTLDIPEFDDPHHPALGRQIGIEIYTIDPDNGQCGHYDFNNVRLFANAVPEPGTLSIAAAGAALCLIRRRRRKA